MMKTSVKFQKNRNKTVGGVAHTRYYRGRKDGRTDGRTDGRKDGRMDGRTDGRKDGRKAKNYVPPLFFEKAGDNNLLACNFVTFTTLNCLCNNVCLRYLV